LYRYHKKIASILDSMLEDVCTHSDIIFHLVSYIYEIILKDGIIMKLILFYLIINTDVLIINKIYISSNYNYHDFTKSNY
jgi:hypothetical protein